MAKTVSSLFVEAAHQLGISAAEAEKRLRTLMIQTGTPAHYQWLLRQMLPIMERCHGREDFIENLKSIVESLPVALTPTLGAHEALVIIANHPWPEARQAALARLRLDMS